MAPRSLDALLETDVRGALIVVRADLNVPLTDTLAVRDTTRLERVIPTLHELSQAGARVAILSHFGRPKGQKVAEMSLQPVAQALSNLVGQDVKFAPDCVGPEAQAVCANAQAGDIIVLENTRFHAGEEKNDMSFAQALALDATAYVNDAFSAAHRAHASTEAIARCLPSYVGRAMQAELQALEMALGNPTRPVVAVVGGAKISTKLDLLGNLTQRVDVLVIGGGMANTFLAAQGIEVGKSLCETSMLDTARDILAAAAQNSCEIILPSDVAVAPEFAAGQPRQIVASEAIAADQMALDAGPETVARVCDAFSKAKTLIWNGPLGAFEIEPFDVATNEAARLAAQLTQNGKLISVAGGGDTVAALNHAGAGPDFTYVSTAGGAFLEWLEGKDLPGVAVLG
jgi:phosphoglycerate kinase